MIETPQLTKLATEINSSLKNYYKETGDLLFRGVSCSCYQLKTSLDVLLHENLGLTDLDLPSCDDIYKQTTLKLLSALNRIEDSLFKGPIPFQLNFKENPELLYKLQQYGYPTPFLDWTESLKIALYFALSGDKKEPTLYVWNKRYHKEMKSNITSMVNNHHCPSFLDTFIDFNKQIHWTNYPQNKRMRNQQATAIYFSQVNQSNQCKRLTTPLNFLLTAVD